MYYPYDPRFIGIPIGGGGQSFPPGFPGGGQPFPPGFPGGGGGFPPSPPPGQGGQGSTQPPTSPPPSFTPQLSASGPSVFAVDPGAIRRCLFRFTYIWQNNGRQFWFYPTFVGRNSVAGFRWTGFFWVYSGIDLQTIREFQCF
ncbi:transporter [Bacillus sp. CGMCC 1.16541]|uniref:transporter n=1 Tax=Bacillus sp. CGMCC 1.16541 TaxID=2185143 RepID=UPI000D726526|nr:transporter [Bacillus sp. CGMCC 1.16541]